MSPRLFLLYAREAAHNRRALDTFYAIFGSPWVTGSSW